ncbi:ABC transporter substrate-binding protein [Herbiconiux sp. A18JL235]|uniref:ABC transporter substrate-binding protein n=1 Tax=Herbiconiux sp. A18JL235 TaxID=3152363 RepID=A0AB39BGE3_9MICO
MRSTRPWTAVAAVAAAAGLILTGCAASGDTSASDGPVTISWWGWNASESQPTIDAFEADNPGITVEFTSYSNSDYLNNLRTALTSDNGPDVLQLAPGATVSNYGALVEDLAPLASASWGDTWADDYNPLGLTQLQSEGKQVALPSYMSAAGFIYYNSDILADTGTTVPENVDEWKATCATIRAAGYDCLAQGAKDAWANLDVYLSLANSIAPGAIYDAIDGAIDWTDPDLIQAMDVWASLFSDGIIAPGATAVGEYPDAFSAFLEKKAAFIALGTWNTPGTMTKTGVEVSQQTVSTPIDSVYLSAPFPAATASSEPTQAFGGPDNGWAISSNSDNKDAAWKFLSFLTGEKGQEIQASVANFPALLDVSVSTDDVVAPDQVANIDEQQDSLGDLIGYRQIPYPELETALGQALSAVAAGTSGSADALKSVQDVSATLSR